MNVIRRHILYPTKCIVCGEMLENPKAQICKLCYNSITIIGENACPKCGKYREESMKLCFDCRTKSHVYSKGRGMLVYDSYTKKSLLGLKFFGYTWVGKVYGELLASYYSEQCNYLIDYVVPVPIHNLRFIQRGYNQAEVIAKAFAKYTKYQLISHLLKRTKNTKPQKELDDKERVINLYSAFKVNKRYEGIIQGKNILIIDDIYTTGTTIDSCSKALLKAGASHVYFLTVAIGDGL